jgi:hypothetical protein
MPSYNQAHFIEGAVESVLAQDDPHWELWILDNSTDRTPELMRRFTDPRIRFIHEPERCDPGTCLNRMLAMAEGDHFSYVHTDNLLRPNYVSALRRALGDHPMALATCDSEVIDGAGRVLSHSERGDDSWEGLFTLGTWAAPFAAGTALAKAIGGFEKKHLADDLIFMIRAWGRGPWSRVPKVLVSYRLHEGSRTEEGGADLEHLHLRTHVAEADRARSEGRTPPEMAARLEAFRAMASEVEAAFGDLREAYAHRVAPLGLPQFLESPGPGHSWLLSALEPAGAVSGTEAAFGLSVVQPTAGLVRLGARVGRRGRAEAWAAKGLRVWAPGRALLPFGFAARWDKVLRALEVLESRRAAVLPALALHHPLPPRRWAMKGTGLASACLGAWARTWFRSEPMGWLEPTAAAPALLGWPLLRDLPGDWDPAQDLLIG